MTTLKVLFADDHIQPHVSDEYIRDRIEEQYPGLNRDEFGRLMMEHRTYLQVLPRAVEALKDDGYEVIPVYSYHEAMREATNTRFDIAIVDMGWYLDKELPSVERGSAGWKICQAIEDADKTSKRTLTAQIVYSNRFASQPSMSIQAAARGILPVFKNENEASYQALKAAVKFISTYLTSPSPGEKLAHDEAARLRQLSDNLLMQPLKQQRIWVNAALICVCTSFALILTGAALAFYGNVQVGTVSSISSLVTAFISCLFYSRLKHTESELKEVRKEVQKELKEITTRIYDREKSGSDSN